MVSCNTQRYEIVNGITEVETTPEDTKMEQEGEKTAEGNFRNIVSSFLKNFFGKDENSLTCFHVFHRRERSSEFLADGLEEQ